MSTHDPDTEQDAIELMVERYLDGQLDPEETAQFERRLMDPAVSEAFGEALMLRQLLAELPPDQAPEELVRQLEEALEVDPGGQRRRTRLLRVRAALDGLSWAVKGPAQALSAGSPTASAAPAAAGLSTMRYALGPLGKQRGAPTAPRKPLWRRVLSRGLRRRSKKKE
jgi:anti-sigma factor RsiW